MCSSDLFAASRWKMERVVKTILAEHRSRDSTKSDSDETGKRARKIERLQDEARKTRPWLKDNPTGRQGAGKATRLSNRTDKGAAKMAADKGVVQGHCGVAVDEQHQIIVEAQAHLVLVAGRCVIRLRGVGWLYARRHEKWP